MCFVERIIFLEGLALVRDVFYRVIKIYYDREGCLDVKEWKILVIRRLCDLDYIVNF